MKRKIAILTAVLLLTGCSGKSSVPESSAASSEQSAPEIISASGEPAASSSSSAPAEEPPSTEPLRTAEPLPSEESAPASEELPVKAAYLEDVPELGEHDEFGVTDDDGCVKVVFTAESAVSGFRVLSISMQDSDSDGKIAFSAEEVYSQPELTPDRPLEVGLQFLGDIPNNGIAFIGTDGAERYYAVDMSGRDGSLILWEISVV